MRDSRLRRHQAAEAALRAVWVLGCDFRTAVRAEGRRAPLAGSWISTGKEASSALIPRRLGREGGKEERLSSE